MTIATEEQLAVAKAQMFKSVGEFFDALTSVIEMVKPVIQTQLDTERQSRGRQTDRGPR
jgi:hypothetical protein